MDNAMSSSHMLCGKNDCHRLTKEMPFNVFPPPELPETKNASESARSVPAGFTK